MERLYEPEKGSDTQVPLQLSRIVKDIQRKNAACLNLQSTVYEAVAWMRDVSTDLVPVIAGDPAKQTITSLQTIAADALLQTLPDRMQDTDYTLGTFFSMPLAEFPCRRVPIVCPRMDLREMVHRMDCRPTDLLLAFDGIRFTGLVTAGDIFDAMIGTAIIDEAFFKGDIIDPGEVLEGIRICCLKHKVAGITDRRVLCHLDPANTILEAVNALNNRSSSGVLVSDRSRKIHRFVAVRDILLFLLDHFECSLSSRPLSDELMSPLKTVCDAALPVLTPHNTVFEAVQTLHFNNLTGAVVLSEKEHIEGVVTIQTLLKAFLDSINQTSSVIFD